METMEQRIRKLEKWRIVADQNFELLKSNLDENTKITKQVLSILTTGKMGAAFIKWSVSIGAGVAVIIGLFYHKL